MAGDILFTQSSNDERHDDVQYSRLLPMIISSKTTNKQRYFILLSTMSPTKKDDDKKDKPLQPKAQHQQQSSSVWFQPLHVLMAIIVLQACFMLFISMDGPSHPSTYEMSYLPGDQRASKSKQVRGGDGNANDFAAEAVRLKALAAQKKYKPPKVTTPPQYKKSLQEKDWDVDSFAFPGALHFHFERERLDPFFRQRHGVTTQSLLERAQQDAKTAQSLMVRSRKPEMAPCHYYSDGPNGPRIRLNELCFQKHNKDGIVIYNSQPFPRIWCGKTILPHKIVHMKVLCENAYTEPPRLLLESDKPLDIIRRNFMKLPPIVFHRVDSYASVEAVTDCDVPCKFTMDTCQDDKGLDAKGEACLPDISDWTVEGTDFKFRYSMLDPRNAPTAIGISRKGYRENQYYATRSFQSEIPLSTFDWDRYGEMQNAPRSNFQRSGKRGVCFMHLEPCQGEIRPGTWASKLKDSFKGKIDYYGPCHFGESLRPTTTARDLSNYQDRQYVMSRYMFTLVVGHSFAPDILSELVWDALTAGSIPVYHGTPNIREHVPPNSIIVASEYPSQQALAQYLENVRSDKTLWEALHAWRDEKATPLEQKYGFLKDKSSSSYCRMCRWALATKYSLGWNPLTQAIEKPALDRKFCTSPKNVLRYPVEEMWASDLSTQLPFGKAICGKYFSEQTMEYDELSVTRKITSHDNGVIDIAITSIKSLRTKLKVLLRLNFRRIANVDGAHIQHPHQLLGIENNPSKHIPLMSSIAIQDDTTRATILTNWVTDLKTPKLEGIVDILVKDLAKSEGQVSHMKDEKGHVPRLMKDEVLRIRIILEDVNRLRDAATEYNVSPYAHQFIADFLDPVMFFMVK
jgi:Glycosyltransferase family 10 (fucosyltransferase) C-term